MDNLKKWVVFDKQLKFVNEKTRQIRESKTALTKELCGFVQQQNLGNKVIEITDGELRFIEKREYSPLSFSYIKDRLEEVISNKADVERIIQYLKDKREIRITHEIRRIEYESDESVDDES